MSTPSFKIPNAAKLACMGLISGASALSNAAHAGNVVVPPPVVATDDHYLTPQDTALETNGASVKTLVHNDTYGGNVISSLSVCPDDGNTQPQLIISIITEPQHGNVNFSQQICDNDSFTPNTFGSFIYTPETGYTGEDSFRYSLTIGNGEPSNATASILVGAQISGGALGAALLVPLAAAGLARRRKKSNPDQ